MTQRRSGQQGPELVELGVAELAARIAAREVSCVEVVRTYLDRIDALNPLVNAIIARRDRDELLAEAADRDRALADGPGGALHGVPFAVKDLAEVAGQPGTAGPPRRPPPRGERRARPGAAAGSGCSAPPSWPGSGPQARSSSAVPTCPSWD